MSGPLDTDVVVIGAGPAGMAAAAEMADLGLRVVVLDEQTEPGGQIWRGVGRKSTSHPVEVDVLGDEYAAGMPVVSAFMQSTADFLPGTAVWQVDADDDGVTVHTVAGGRTRRIRAAGLIAATGAMERAMPVPGWTLPGVMTAGAAQILLKTADMVPEGRVVLAGAGPLLLLVANQLAAAGADVAAVLETVGWREHLDAAPFLPKALGARDDLAKGIRLRRALVGRGVPVLRAARDIAIEGDGRAEAVAHSRGRVPADVVLLHDGVVPNVQLTRQMRVPHLWHAVQRCWHPAGDAWGRVSGVRLWVAGDGAGIEGWRVAILRGRRAALDAARDLGRISRQERDASARELDADVDHATAVRPLLDHLFPPRSAADASDDVVVCRCEEVTAGALREAVRLGATGANQVKTFTRAGMGPCQGRTCGLAVAEIVAAARGLRPEDVEVLRGRVPVRPLTLGTLANDGGQGGGEP